MKSYQGKAVFFLLVFLLTSLLAMTQIIGASRSCGSWELYSTTTYCRAGEPYEGWTGTKYRRELWRRMCTFQGQEHVHYRYEDRIIGGCGGSSGGGGGGGGGDDDSHLIHSYGP